MRALAKILRARASEHSSNYIFASNSSIAKILQAPSNWMGPFDTPNNYIRFTIYKDPCSGVPDKGSIENLFFFCFRKTSKSPESAKLPSTRRTYKQPDQNYNEKETMVFRLLLLFNLVFLNLQPYLLCTQGRMRDIKI